MRKLNTYIIEKLHISKGMKTHGQNSYDPKIWGMVPDIVLKYLESKNLEVENITEERIAGFITDKKLVFKLKEAIEYTSLVNEICNDLNKTLKTLKDKDFNYYSQFRGLGKGFEKDVVAFVINRDKK